MLLGTAGKCDGNTGMEPMVSVQVRSLLITTEYVTIAVCCGWIHCTLYSVVHGPELLATDQPTGSWLVASSLFLSACPLGAGAFVYEVRGRETINGLRRSRGSFTFSDNS